MKFLTTNTNPATTACDVLCLGVRADSIDTDLQPLGASFAAQVRQALAHDDFKGKAGKAVTYPTFGNVPAKSLIIFGVGDGGADGVRRGVGKAGYECRTLGATAVLVGAPGLQGAALGLAARAFHEGNYRFDKYKAEDARKAPTDTVTFLAAEDPSLGFARAVSQGQELCRDLVNEPAAVIYPETLAEAARALANDVISVEVWDEKRIRDAGMGGISGVGQGSARPPRFIHLHYKPAGTPRSAVTLVGKGVTFDSGGLSLKPSAGMQTMRCDMGGAASVLGAFQALSVLRPAVEVHGLVGAVENMPSGTSYKLGDVLRMYNGKTVEIHNTDAEGRLVLADLLAYASKHLAPKAIVDMATLTGAIVVALGNDHTGLFTQDDALAQALTSSGKAVGERLWRMPMEEDYRELLKADWATIKNVGGPSGGSITAALFLSEFVDAGIPFAHLDIAGTAFTEKANHHFAPGGTGAPVATLVEWIRTL